MTHSEIGLYLQCNGKILKFVGRYMMMKFTIQNNDIGSSVEAEQERQQLRWKGQKLMEANLSQ